MAPPWRKKEQKASVFQVVSGLYKGVLIRHKYIMFDFAIEKFLSRFLFLFSFIGFLGVFVYAYYTEVSNSPFDTDVAPFEDNVGAVSDSEILQMGKKTPLSKPHVNTKEIQNWLNTSVSESLTFEGRDYQKVITKARSYFTAAGFVQYKTYLEEAKIIETLQSGSYRIGLFFDQNPYVSRGFNYEGVYRWQAQMPLSLSFKSLTTRKISNREINLSLQIKRVEDDNIESGVQIDSWTVSASRR